MNSRRLRYSFLSVTSELGMSAARLISMGQLYEPFGVNSCEIPENQPEVSPRSLHPAVLLPPSCRRHRPLRCAEESTARPQPPHQIDVLHDGQITVTPELGKNFPPDEQRLIAVRQAEQLHPHADADLDDARRRRWRVERES